MERVGKRFTPLVAGVVLLQLVAVYALVLSLQRQLAAGFADNARVTLDGLAESVTDRSQRFMGPARDAVGVGVELLDRGVLDAADDAALEIWFHAQLAATPWLGGLFLGRADGSFVYLARNEFGLRTKRITVRDGRRSVEIVQRDADGRVEERRIDVDDDYDPRTRSWYREAQGVDGVAWTDPYLFFSSGRPGITAAARAADGTVMGADVEIHELSAFIERIPHARDGTAVIVDDELNVIARSGADGLRPNVPKDTIPRLDEVARAPLRALREAAGPAAPGAPGSLVQLESQGSVHLGLARTFRVADNAPEWTLLVQMRADDYAGGALSFLHRRVVLLGVLSLGLGALAFGGLLWPHRSARRAEVPVDPVTGTLPQERFSALLEERANASGTVGVAVVEAIDLVRLADRLGSPCRDAVTAEIGRRLGGVLEEGDLLGISPGRRHLVAVGAPDRRALLERFERLHEAAAGDGTFPTHCGPQTVRIVAGAAVLEPGEAPGNLLPRAREALALSVAAEPGGSPGQGAAREADRGTDRGASRCALAVGFGPAASGPATRSA